MSFNVIKTALKRAIQKIPEPTGNLFGNKIADKITTVSKSQKSAFKWTCVQKQMRVKQICQKKDISLLKNKD